MCRNRLIQSEFPGSVKLIYHGGQFANREVTLGKGKDDVLRSKIAIAIPIPFRKRRIVCDAVVILSGGKHLGQIGDIEYAIRV